MASKNFQQDFQLLCRRRVAKKLAATLSFPDFRFPTTLSAEQCTGDDLADIHASLIPCGSKVVDLTCGLGIDAFHLARRADSVLAIDRDPIVADAIGPNAAALGLTNVTGLCADCTDWLKECDDRFDIAFIDPARRAETGRRLFSLHDCQPDIIALLPEIQRIAPKVIAKMSPMLDIDAVVRELPLTQRIHVLGTPSECKELVAEIGTEPVQEPEIIVHTVGHPTLRFRRSQLPPPSPCADEIRVGDIIGEPWPTVMKAAPWTLLPGRKIHPDTHLWLNPAPGFPGKTYEIERIEEFSSSNIKRLAKERLEASVAVKNLPITAAELTKRLKTRESSTRRLIALTTSSSRLLLLATSAGKHACP